MLEIINIVLAGMVGQGYRPSITGMILGAGPIVKLVLLLLLFFSLFSWAIIFTKWVAIRRAEKESRLFFRMFSNNKKLSDTYRDSQKIPTCPIAKVFQSGYSEIEKLSRAKVPSGVGNPSDHSSFSINLGALDNIERSMKQAAHEETSRLEKWIGFLATTGSTTPFIGLFGTVWGIMDSFREIGFRGSANLASVAPGISEALIATAAGLAAAIPAVIFYNYYLSKINYISSQMDNFTAEFLNIIKRHFLAR